MSRRDPNRFPGLKPETIDPKLFPAWMAMELSGYFQMCILEALEG